MNSKIFVVAMALALFSVAWNILALLLNVMFGLSLPAIDPGTFG